MDLVKCVIYMNCFLVSNYLVEYKLFVVIYELGYVLGLEYENNKSVVMYY